MDPIEALLTRKLDELESEEFSLENTKEPESMSNENFSHQSATKIRSKIAFTKSLLSFQDQSKDLSSLRERISVVEEAFVHLSADFGTQASYSPTSIQAEDVGEEDAEMDGNVDDYNGIPIKAGYLGHIPAREMKWKGEEKGEELDGFVNKLSCKVTELPDPNGLIHNAIGSDGSSSCSWTSACVDKGEEMMNQAVEEENTVSTVSETENLCSFKTEKVMEAKVETADSGGGDGALKFRKLLAFGAMVGIFAVAAIGVMFGRFSVDKDMVNLVPT